MSVQSDGDGPARSDGRSIPGGGVLEVRRLRQDQTPRAQHAGCPHRQDRPRASRRRRSLRPWCRWRRLPLGSGADLRPAPHHLFSAGTLDPTGRSSRTWTGPVRSRSPSPARTTTAPASPWCTATSAGTARAGSRSKPDSTHQTAGRSTSLGTRPSPAGSIGRPVSKPDLLPLAEEERAELLALLRELAPVQWDAPSLCADVAGPRRGHPRRQLRRAVDSRGPWRPSCAAGFGTGLVNEVALASYRRPQPGRHHRTGRPQPAPERSPRRLPGRGVHADERHDPSTGHSGEHLDCRAPSPSAGSSEPSPSR